MPRILAVVSGAGQPARPREGENASPRLPPDGSDNPGTDPTAALAAGVYGSRRWSRRRRAACGLAGMAPSDGSRNPLRRRLAGLGAMLLSPMMAGRRLELALVQMTSTEDRAANLDHAERLVHEAA